MKSIKFSHRYVKMPMNVVSGSTVKLLQVFRYKFENLSPGFLMYDTTKVSSGQYELPLKGDCLVLLLQGIGLSWDSGEVFTTVRTWDEETENYYLGMMGKEFIVIIDN